MQAEVYQSLFEKITKLYEENQSEFIFTVDELERKIQRFYPNAEIRMGKDGPYIRFNDSRRSYR